MGDRTGRRDGETGRGSREGENDRVSDAAPGLSADEILAVLVTGADRPLDDGARVSQFDHALADGDAPVPPPAR